MKDKQIEELQKQEKKASNGRPGTVLASTFRQTCFRRSAVFSLINDRRLPDEQLYGGS